MPKNAVYEQDITDLKQKFKQIASELDAIKKDSYRDAETLERLKKTLDIEYVTKLITTLESLEKKADKAHKESQKAAQQITEYKEELQKEGTRLEKLWDAYKKQENDLEGKQDTITSLEKQLEAIQKQHADYEKNASELQSLRKDRERMLWLESEVEKYTRENQELATTSQKQEEVTQNLHQQIKNLEQYIPYKKQVESLEKQIEELKPLQGYVKYKKQTEKLEKLYTQEQERLAKLYKIYEDTTMELGAVKKQLDQWKTWFKENSVYIEAASRAVKNLKTPESLAH